MDKVIIEMNEKQARIVLAAVEEWFRLRLGQDRELSDGLAFMGYKHDKEFPERFNEAIRKRDSIRAVVQAMFKIAWPAYGAPLEADPEVHIASDIWSQMRWELSEKSDIMSTPFQMGSEPMPKVTVVKEG